MFYNSERYKLDKVKNNNYDLLIGFTLKIDCQKSSRNTKNNTGLLILKIVLLLIGLCGRSVILNILDYR